MNLEKFNEKQLEAVTAPMGPIAVIAGAGTGKTHVLTSRFIYLLEEYQLLPNRILAITFTNKAANEMKRRIEVATRIKNLQFLCTFHSLCLRILREDIDQLGRKNNFNVIDEEDSIDLLKEIYKEKSLLNKDFPYRKVYHLIDVWKSNELGPEGLDVVLNSNDYYGFTTEGALRTAYAIYLSFLEKQLHLNLLDFNDLITLAKKLLSNYENVRKKWRDKFDYILVDEFQDVNNDQFEIINYLVNTNNDLFVVGDPDQTIYTWRGAKAGILQEFMQEYSNTKLIILDKNYRSTQNILDIANNVIKFNSNRYEKNLYTDNVSGNKIIYFQGADEKSEAEWVCKKIEEILKDKKVSPNEICILYRSKHLSRTLEQTCIERGIRYKVIGGYKFYQRKEIKDIIAYFKVIDNGDELSLKRIANIPRRRISSETISKISLYCFENKLDLFDGFLKAENIEELSTIAKQACVNFANLIIKLREFEENHTLTELFDEVYKKTEYDLYLQEDLNETRDDYVKEFKQAINFYESNHEKNEITLNKYLQDIALFTSLDEESNNNKDAVLLMTVHQAKGLEFEYVFLTNFTDDSFPSLKSQEENNIEEERRVAYVALTRPKKHLYVSMNAGYNIRIGKDKIPSRFFESMFTNKKDLLQEDTESVTSIRNHDLEWYDSNNKIDASSMYVDNDYEFKIGDKIVHTHFGEGKIIEVTHDSIKVFFNNTKTKGIKILAKNHKAIKRIIN